MLLFLRLAKYIINVNIISLINSLNTSPDKFQVQVDSFLFTHVCSLICMPAETIYRRVPSINKNTKKVQKKSKKEKDLDTLAKIWIIKKFTTFICVAHSNFLFPIKRLPRFHFQICKELSYNYCFCEDSQQWYQLQFFLWQPHIASSTSNPDLSVGLLIYLFNTNICFVLYQERYQLS